MTHELPDRALVRTTIEADVATVRLDFPERLNAMSPRLVEELRGALETARDAGARIVVLVGSGRAFCAGHDLKAEPLEPASAEAVAHLENLQQVTRILRDETIISIAALHGYALGAGLELALGCDFIVADESTILGFPEVAVGLSVTGGATYLLPQAVGLPLAKELILLGEEFTAVRAQSIGLLSHVVADGKHLEAALALASRLLDRPRRALRLAKASLEAGASDALESAMALEIDYGRVTGDLADAHQALEEFVGRTHG